MIYRGRPGARSQLENAFRVNALREHDFILDIHNQRTAIYNQIANFQGDPAGERQI